MAKSKIYEVNPMSIDKKEFEKERQDKRQEVVRQIIIKALYIVKEEPDKYGRKFKTLVPEEEVGFKSVKYFVERSTQIGDHMANWVEQALEWAQKIINGASWESICNEQDMSKYARLVIWNNSQVKIVGGSCKSSKEYTPSSVSSFCCGETLVLDDVVPLVVSYY